jgi:hypothetical protein
MAWHVSAPADRSGCLLPLHLTTLAKKPYRGYREIPYTNRAEHSRSISTDTNMPPCLYSTKSVSGSCRKVCVSGSDDTESDGQAGQTGNIINTQLGLNVGHVMTHCLWTEVQEISDIVDRLAVCQQTKHLEFAR